MTDPTPAPAMAATAATEAAGAEAPASRCSRCGAAFVCGYVAGLSECWCARQPFLPATGVVPDQLCLCPACLRERKSALANRPDECQNRGNNI